MKISELIEKDKQLQEDLKDEDCCGLCATHEAAYRQLDRVIYCPHCHTAISEGFQYSLDEDDFRVVGDWYADPDEEIRMLPILKCEECGEEFALVPMRVIHNYNHDVYYTGKKHILPKFNERDFVKKIEPDIENYLNRYKKEKDLSTWNLATWISRDLEQYICELIENNYKEIYFGGDNE